MKLTGLVYRLLGWGLVALGTLHMLTTAALRGTTPAGRVWFFGAGIAMVLTGALNLLNDAHGASARGVHWVCVAGNVLMTGFGIAAGVYTGASPAMFATVVGLVGGATVLSLLRGR